jgi:hypothetical protein
MVCRVEQPLSSFHFRNVKKGYRQSVCKECHRIRKHEWDNQHRPNLKDANRRAHLKRTYGITEEQYQEIFQKQNGNCAVCKRHQTVFKQRLAVDHNHKTGQIRGLLCNHCNRYVIGRRNDPELYKSASEYLRQGTDHFVPDRPKKKKRRKRTKKKK